jgi:hypothetical protein
VRSFILPRHPRGRSSSLLIFCAILPRYFMLTRVGKIGLKCAILLRHFAAIFYSATWSQIVFVKKQVIFGTI